MTALLSGPANAQVYEGETPVELGRGFVDEDGNILRLRSMTISWRFAGFMGEPLRRFAGRYEHHSPPWVELAKAKICFMGNTPMLAFSPVRVDPQMVAEGVLEKVEMYAHTRFRMTIQPNGPVSFSTGPMWRVQHEFTVDSFSQSEDYGVSISGSPSWDRLFQIGRPGGSPLPWLSEAEAKELFRVGFQVVRIDMIEPRFAVTLVQSSYDRHFAERACGDEPAEDKPEDGVRDPIAELAEQLRKDQQDRAEGNGPAGTAGAENASEAQYDAHRAKARATHAEAVAACEASGPRAPYYPPPGLTLTIMCSDDCPTEAEKARAAERRSAERAREQEKRAAEKRQYETALASWRSNALPRCLATADSELERKISQVDGQEENVKTLRSLLPDLRERLRNTTR